MSESLKGRFSIRFSIMVVVLNSLEAIVAMIGLYAIRL